MNEALQVGILLLVAIAGTAVVLTRTIEHQVIGVSAFGLILAVMFTVFQAPDVALSQLAIGAVGFPLMFCLAIACLKRHDQRARRHRKENR